MNNKPKFTPGPWTSRKGMRYPAVVVTQTTDEFIYVAEKIDAEANAALIAAAPEMYDALALLLHYEGSRDNLGLGQFAVVKDKARAALSKARGEG